MINRLLTRLAIGAAAILIAAAGGIVAVTFLIIAMYELLETVMEPWIAALATAGIAVLFCVLVLLLARIAMRTMAPAPPKTAARSNLGGLGGMGFTSEIGTLLGKEARDFVQNNSMSTLGILVVAGFALGVSPKLRKLIWKLL
jgi:hypothetical protein